MEERYETKSLNDSLLNDYLIIACSCVSVGARRELD